jgi:HPt (histidine-containing phosphotransfer) domain-containing protein
MTKIINKSTLLENYGDYGNDFIIEIIDMFFEEHIKSIEGIKEAISTNDSKKIDFWAHKIKSSYRNFENPCLPGELSFQLEMMGKENNISNAASVFQELLIQNTIFIEDLNEIKNELK